MRPRLYRGEGRAGLPMWRCAGNMCNGEGRTPINAYRDWERQCRWLESLELQSWQIPGFTPLPKPERTFCERVGRFWSARVFELGA